MQASTTLRKITVQISHWRKAGMMAVLLLTALLPASAELAAQTITLSANKMPLEKLCKEIEKQTGYFFVYAKDMEKSQPVTVTLKNESITAALEKVFKGTSMKYEVIGKVVSVNTRKRTEEGPKKNEVLETDTLNIRGYVVTEKGPLENASVTTTKSKKSTLTDRNGAFVLKGVLPQDELVFTYVGYTPLRLKVGKTRDFVAALIVAENELDKVVVKAYGTTSRRFSTSSIVSVSGKEIENVPVQNPMLALAGRVPGLVVQSNTGEPMAPVRVEVRGRNSINPNFPTDPLYVIDGVPQTVMNIFPLKRSADGFPTVVSPGLNQSDAYVAGGGISPLFGLNPYDIASIEVLQDAGATAVYGSRGANGVILITTKRGKAGKTSVSVNLGQGVTYVSKFHDVLNIREYVAMRKEAIANDGYTPNLISSSPGFAPDLLLWDTTRDVNWQKYMFGNPGMYSNVNTTVSGGTEQMTFRISGAYSRVKDIKVVSGINQSMSVNGALDYKSVDKKFTMNLSLSVVNGTSNALIAPISVYSLPPNAPDPFDTLGNLNFKEYRISNTMPFTYLKNLAETKSRQFMSSIEFRYLLMKGLSLGTAIRTRQSSSDIFNITTVASKDPLSSSGQRDGMNQAGQTDIKGTTIEPFISYGTTLGNGALDVSLRGTYEHNKTTSITLQGTKYTTDDLIRSIKDAPVKTITDRYGEYKYLGGMLGISYRLFNRYLADLTLRRDGNTRFGPGKRFGNFGSLGLGWIITEEEWAKKNLPAFISFLKPSLNYGFTGSDQVGEFRYLTQWGNSGSQDAPVIIGYDSVMPKVPQLQANRDFHWSTSRQLNLGLQIGLFNKISITLNAYRNRTNDQLVSYPTGVYTGFTYVTANSPAEIQNTGWSLAVEAQAINTMNFSWRISFNTSRNNNKLLSYPNLELSPWAFTYKIGESVNLSYLYKYLGVDPATGEPRFTDQNKDGLIRTSYSVVPGTADDDRVVSVNRMPVFQGYMGHNFRYKNFNLALNFNLQRFDAQNLTSGRNGLALKNIGRWEYENRWTTPGQEARAPRLTVLNTPQDKGVIGSSDGAYTKANFIRLNQTSFGYILNKKMANRIGMQDMSVSLNGTNLLLLTNYEGLDPEIGNNISALPPMSTISLTVNCNF